MSQVLDIEALFDSPLADLHALAYELDVDGYRLMRREDLTVTLLVKQGADADEVQPRVIALAAEIAERRKQEEAERREAEEADRAERQQRDRERREAAAATKPARSEKSERGDKQAPPARRRRRGGSSSAEGAAERAPERGRGERSGRRTPQTVAVNGVLEFSGSGGYLRPTVGPPTSDDIFVSQSLIGKSNLRRGDVVTGQAKAPRRNERTRSLAEITTVNGIALSEISGKGKDRAQFDKLSPVFATRKISPRSFKSAPFGNGSRVLIVGSQSEGTTALIRSLASEFAGRSGLTSTLVVVAPRPEEQAELAAGSLGEVVSGSFTRPVDEVSGLTEFAIERGKRLAEAGGDAIVLIEGLDLLPPSKARDYFAAARQLDSGGSLTVVATVAPGSAFEAVATTIAIPHKRSNPSKPKIDGRRSATVESRRLK